MKSKKLLVLLIVCLGLGVVASWLFTPRHHVNREGFEKIQIGMTSSRVQEILGGPSGDYSTGVVKWEQFARLEARILRWSFGTPKTWSGDEGELMVWFSSQGVVREKHMVPGVRVQASFFRKLGRTELIAPRSKVNRLPVPSKNQQKRAWWVSDAGFQIVGVSG